MGVPKVRVAIPPSPKLTASRVLVEAGPTPADSSPKETSAALGSLKLLEPRTTVQPVAQPLIRTSSKAMAVQPSVPTIPQKGPSSGSGLLTG